MRVYDTDDGMGAVTIETDAPRARVMHALVNDYAIVLQDADRERSRAATATEREQGRAAVAATSAQDAQSNQPTSGTAIGSTVRTRDQARADAAYELLMLGAQAAASGAGVYRPNITVHVTVPMDTLVGSTDRPGELAGHGPITARQARALAFEPGSVWRRLLTDPLSGAVLDVGTTRYRPTAAIVDHVTAAMPRCLFPSCSRPAGQCDLDHNAPFDHASPDHANPDHASPDHASPDHGGHTSAANLGPLCRRHHEMKTSGGWTWSVEPTTGVIVWTTPTGRIHRKHSEPVPC